MVITYLDVSCLGHWAAFWDPCRSNPEQFNRVVVYDAGGSIMGRESWIINMQVLFCNDMCKSRRTSEQTTIHKCAQVVLLRLQDLWLPKLIMSGLLIPAGRLARDRSMRIL